MKKTITIHLDIDESTNKLVDSHVIIKDGDTEVFSGEAENTAIPGLENYLMAAVGRNVLNNRNRLK